MGELASLGAAMLWALAVSLFRPAISLYGPRAINLAKCTVSALALGITAVIAGQASTFFRFDQSAYWVLILSGVIGLTIGDTALFTAVREIGPPRTLLIQSFVPLFTAAIAIVTIGEWPTGPEWLGAALVIAGVVFVVSQRIESGTARMLWKGILFSTIAALCQATGIVMSKIGMDQFPVLSASFLRIAAAALGLWLWLPLGGGGGRLRTLGSGGMAPRVVGASMLGTYIAILLMMTGVAFTKAAIASVLLSTTPIFSLFIDAKLNRQAISIRGLLGAVIAVMGVAIMFIAP